MTLANLVRCYTPTIGTGTLAIGAAILKGFEDVANGTTVSYSIIQGDITAGFDAEVGRGVYDTGTLTRATVLSSTNGGAKIALDGTAQVVITALAEDFLSGSGTTGQLVKWTGAGTIGDAAIIPPASNILTLTNAAASTLALNITTAKTLTLTAVDNYTLTIPATGTAGLLGTSQIWTGTNKINVNSTTAFFVEQDGVKDNTFVVDTTNGKVAIGAVPTTSFLDISGSGSNFIDLIQTSTNQININFTNSGKTGLFQFDNGGNMIFRTNQTGLYFDAKASAFINFRTSNSLLSRIFINNNGNISIGYEGLKQRLYILDTTITTNAIQEVVRIEAVVSTAATGGATGFGPGLSLWAETATDGTSQQQARVAALWTDATNATRNAMYQEETYPAGTAIGHRGLWSQTAIAGSAFTIIANGTGDVTEIITIQYSCAEITGTYTGGGVVSLEPNTSYDICSDGTSTLTITCAADGSVTIARSAGSDQFKFVGSMVWL